MHLILPFQYQDKEVMSELWVDPDAHKEEDEAQGGRKDPVLVRFEISGVGDFDWRLLCRRERQSFSWRFLRR